MPCPVVGFKGKKSRVQSLTVDIRTSNRVFKTLNTSTPAPVLAPANRAFAPLASAHCPASTLVASAHCPTSNPAFALLAPAPVLATFPIPVPPVLATAHSPVTDPVPASSHRPSLQLLSRSGIVLSWSSCKIT
ncbi:hypothetical protein MRB53_026935 [Persea americana]|uniref:Uncharacterized protein n=1 Tax=Persea americana TaxID=3435 RepID=A0ACC2LKM0_PERAE|nr:hypothetical protein MRB53_026935 [Persea americana]